MEGDAGSEKLMQPSMQPLEKKSLGEFGPYLAMRPLGKQVQDALDIALRALPAGGVLAVDFQGVQMMDYSFADEALGTIYSRMSTKEYPDRYMVLLVEDDPVSQALLENVEVALSQREAAAIAVPGADLPVLHEAIVRALAGKEPLAAHRPGAWKVIGKLPEHLIETLGAVMEKGSATVRDVVDTLGLDSVTACNNRIARLHQLRLVRRKAAIVPEGGRLYCYSGVF